MSSYPVDRSFDMLHCYLAKDPAKCIEIPYCEIANGNIVKLETANFEKLLMDQERGDVDPIIITSVHVEIDGVIEKIEGGEFCKEMEKQLGRGKFAVLGILPVGQEPRTYVRTN